MSAYQKLARVKRSFKKKMKGKEIKTIHKRKGSEFDIPSGQMKKGGGGGTRFPNKKKDSGPGTERSVRGLTRRTVKTISEKRKEGGGKGGPRCANRLKGGTTRHYKRKKKKETLKREFRSWGPPTTQNTEAIL